MLVISRRNLEEIVLKAEGLQPVTIKVLQIRGSQVRIGINAGSEFKIVRAELIDASHAKSSIALLIPELAAESAKVG